jgi:hypothetical protein
MGKNEEKRALNNGGKIKGWGWRSIPKFAGLTNWGKKEKR